MNEVQDELLPCPFCGGEAAIVEFKSENVKSWKYDGVNGFLSCRNNDCRLSESNAFWFIEGDEGFEKSDAIKAWNSRTDIHESRVQELLESNNALLERARKAEERVKELESNRGAVISCCFGCEAEERIQAAIKHLEITVPSGLEFSALYKILKR